MASGEVRLRINHAKLTAYAGTVSRTAVHKAATKAQQRARANITQSGLGATGKLSSTMQTRDIPGNALFPRVAVGSPVHYAKYPEHGTRAHGPVRAKVLRFKPKGAAGFVYARWVRGVRPYKFMRRALDSVRPTDFE